MANAKKLKSGNWRVLQFVGTKNGKRKYKSFTAPTKKEAEYLALDYVNNTKHEEKNAITLKEAFDEYILSRSETLSITTITEYERCRNMYFQPLMDKLIDTITRQDLQNAMNEQCRTVSKRYGTRPSPKTIQNNFSLLLSVLRYYDIEFSSRKFAMPQKVKIEYSTPDKETAQRILAATYDTKLEIPVLLAMWLSLRRSEVCGLRWSDINYKKGIISINQSKVYVAGASHIKPPKNTKSQRAILLPPYIETRLKAWKKRTTGDYVVAIPPNSITRDFAKILNDNDIPHCRFHDLRHAFVSFGKALNIPDAYLMKSGGWENEKVMNGRYTQTYTDFEKQMSDEMNGFFEQILPKCNTKCNTKSIKPHE